MKKLLIALASSLCLLCSQQSFAAEKQSEVIARIDDDGVQRVRIVGGDYFFEPARIIVKVNVPVELWLSKEAGVVPHSFAIHAPESGIVIDEELDATVKKVSFVPKAAGIFPYYCKNRLLFFKSHREKGMEGVLEVLP